MAAATALFASPVARSQEPSGASTGYTLRLGGRTFLVEERPEPGTPKPAFYARSGRPVMPYFRTTEGAVVADPETIRRLGVAFWTVERVTSTPEIRQRRSQIVAGLLETWLYMKGYEMAQDAVVRLSVELFANAATNGYTGASAFPRGGVGTLRSTVIDPKLWLTGLVYSGLSECVKAYREMEAILDSLAAPPYDVEKLERVHVLYRRGSGLERTFLPALSKLMPQTAWDLATAALLSAVSELYAILGKFGSELQPAAFAKELFGVGTQARKAGPVGEALAAVAAGLKLSQAESAFVDATLEHWVAESTIRARTNLPVGLREYLETSVGPSWKPAPIAEDTYEYCLKGSALDPNFVSGDFDGDRSPDWAAFVCSSANCHVMIFLARPSEDGFAPFIVETQPAERVINDYLSISRKGGRYFDHENDSGGIFRTDAVTSVHCESSAVAFVWNGSFFKRVFISD